MLFQHREHFKRADQVERARARHLKVLKASLLNEHYLDHEVRFDHLTKHIVAKAPIVPDMLRDPARNDQESFRHLQRQRMGPGGPDDDAARGPSCHTQPWGAPSSTTSSAASTRCAPRHLPATWSSAARGGAAVPSSCAPTSTPTRSLIASSGSPIASGRREADDKAPEITRQGVAGFTADLNLVRDGFSRFGLLDDRVRFLQGPLDADLPDAPASNRSPCCGSDAPPRRKPAMRWRPLRPPRARRCRHRRRGCRRAGPGGGVPGRAGHHRSARARRCVRCLWRRTEARSSRWAQGGDDRRDDGAPASRAAHADRDDRSLSRRRLLQHAPRGGPHPALAVAPLPGAASTTSSTR